MDEEERWRTMDPFDYKISNRGRVRSGKSGRILQTYRNSVIIRHEGETIRLSIQKLMDDYFPSPYIWRVITNFRSYEMNNIGEIRKRRTGWRIKPYIDRKGRIWVQLTDAGRQYKVLIDDLQADVFKR